MTSSKRLTPDEAYARMKSRTKKYYNDNKAKYHEYYLKHQTEKSERMKLYRQENKEKIDSYFKNKKCRCDICGVDFLIGSKANHFKSKLHDYNVLKQRFRMIEQPIENNKVIVQ